MHAKTCRLSAACKGKASHTHFIIETPPYFNVYNISPHTRHVVYIAIASVYSHYLASLVPRPIFPFLFAVWEPDYYSAILLGLLCRNQYRL